MKRLAENKGHSESITDIVWNPTSDNVFFTTSKDKNLAHSKIKGTSIEIPAESVVTLVVGY